MRGEWSADRVRLHPSLRVLNKQYAYAYAYAYGKNHIRISIVRLQVNSGGL